MRIRGAFSESGTDSQGRHRTAPVHVAALPSGAGARQVPPIVFLKRATEEAGPKGAERVAHPRHRRAQIAQSSIRVPANCAHHLADVRGRHRQERRAPRAGETLSSRPGRNRALVVVVRRTHDRQSVERGPLALCVHRAPELLGARGHGPVHAAPRGIRCASRTGRCTQPLPHVQRRHSWAGRAATSQYGS